jgi:endonuclease/exonuclease/phosphatase family metal-dependent hydrolase
VQNLRGLTAGVIWLCFAAVGAADTIRVTTWNLQWFPSGSPKLASPEVEAERIRSAAKTLSVLNPDVLMVQEVRDEITCRALADALAPVKYHVLVCSSFKDAIGGGVAPQQVAILAKVPADSAWAETWKSKGQVDPPRGFAFALVTLHSKRVGFYSVHLKSNLTSKNNERERQMNILKREISAGQILRHAESIDRDNAGVAGFVVAGDFNTNPDDDYFVSERTLPILRDANFRNPILDLPRGERTTWPSDGRFPDATFDFILPRSLTSIGKPEILPTQCSDHRPVTVELRLP